jgi:hypothetical protein
MAKFIKLEEILANREQKEKELEFYRQKLEEIEQKMYWLNRDLEITNIIIEMIETNTVPKIGK